MIKAWGSCS